MRAEDKFMLVVGFVLILFLASPKLTVSCNVLSKDAIAPVKS